MKTIVYVDGFNLYYGALKGTPYKWLDVAKLCQNMLPGHDITHIKYFTAHVTSRPNDPQLGMRQQIYLRALRTLPYFDIYLGHFLSNTCMLPLANPPAGGPKFVKVIRTEEKGSDVNLATHLVADAFFGHLECSVLITNDSDLLTPMLVAKDLGFRAGIINPCKQRSRQLEKNADFVYDITPAHLRQSQFPLTLTDAKGTIRKPTDW